MRSDESMKIITVTGYKGGCGKSMTAIHVATFLSECGDTLLVDSDPNRTSKEWARRGSLPFQVVTERQLARANPESRDWLIFDTPARPRSDDLQEMVEEASLLILPTIPDVVSVDPMIQTAQELGNAPYRALLTIVPPRPNLDGVTMQKELRDEGVPVFDTMIRQAVGFRKAAIAGVPVRDLKGRDQLGWSDYKALGKEILEILKDG